MARKRLPTLSELKEAFEYDANTGELKWARYGSSRAVKGAAITRLNDHGYIIAQCNGTLCRAHRIIWCLQTGNWPECGIDHINGIRNDNRWCNLRLASHRENAMNSKRHSNKSSSPYKGVYFQKYPERVSSGRIAGRWVAKIKAEGRPYHIGYFDTAEEARAAYLAAATRHFRAFANPG